MLTLTWFSSSLPLDQATGQVRSKLSLRCQRKWPHVRSKLKEAVKLGGLEEALLAIDTEELGSQGENSMSSSLTAEVHIAKYIAAVSTIPLGS